jgi:hypothetical protein
MLVKVKKKYDASSGWLFTVRRASEGSDEKEEECKTLGESEDPEVCFFWLTFGVKARC